MDPDYQEGYRHSSVFKFPSPTDMQQATKKAIQEKSARDEQIAAEVWNYYKERCASAITAASSRGETCAKFDMADFGGRFRGNSLIDGTTTLQRLNICADKMRQMGYDVITNDHHDWDMKVIWEEPYQESP